MFGNHHTSHSSGFQSPDIGSGGYPYFSPAAHHHHHIQTHQMHSQNSAVSAAYAAQVIQPNNSPANATNAIQSASNNSNHVYSSAVHPHLYSPSAIEYGIHTTSSNNSPSEQYFEHSESGYYNSGNGGSTSNNNGSPMPENHIISSDGLSYTNLDYIAYQHAHGNAAYLHASEEKVHLHYNEDIMPNGQAINHHSGNIPWHHSHNHVYPAEGSGNLSNQLNIATMSGNSLSSQQQINHSMHSPNGIPPTQSTSPTSQNQQQQQSNHQQNVPQYKWMQVKRNVPKPQSECKNFKENSEEILPTRPQFCDRLEFFL